MSVRWTAEVITVSPKAAGVESGQLSWNTYRSLLHAGCNQALGRASGSCIWVGFRHRPQPPRNDTTPPIEGKIARGVGELAWPDGYLAPKENEGPIWSGSHRDLRCTGVPLGFVMRSGSWALHSCQTRVVRGTSPVASGRTTGRAQE